MQIHRKVLWAIALLLLASFASAQERILDFYSDIRIEADGAMLVTETIRVHAEGTNIRRGIYREFPTRYRDRVGNTYNVAFEVLGLRRNGRDEPWNAYRRSNGVRVDFGDDSFLSVPADYTYELRYRTTRQVGFFKDHDELYWNVTGLGWNFTIEQAGATVVLPQAIPAPNLTMEGYTGQLRARGQDYRTSVSDGVGMIRTTKALPPNEGLTLVLSWPKGIVRQPTQVEEARNVLSDNRGVLLALMTLFAVGFYLASAWSKVGRDPDPGVIFPHYEPPKGVSPATANHVMRMGRHADGLTAALVNLAVKGHLQITQERSKYELALRSSNQIPSDDERLLLGKIFAGDEVVELKNKNHALLGEAVSLHHQSLKKANHGLYYLNNSRYLLPSLLGSVVMFGVIIAMNAVVPLVVFTFALIALLHILFAWLLRAPTAAGRELMDKLEGFKLYLNVAEKDEMNLRNPPQITPQLFERFLPYAIALGVEQRWGKRFTRALDAAGQEPSRHYHPIWYTGHFNPGRINDFTKDIGNGFGSAISSAATAPGSTSGSGGGGFSGGGGGGGGGGGR